MKKIDISSYKEIKQMEYVEKVRDLLGGRELNYFIETYGCQMNVHDSEKLAGMLVQMGYKQTDNKADADIIILNTCCVRENAELRVYGNLGFLKAYKDANPDIIIAVCGCMMQETEVVENIKRRFKFVDIVFGSHNTHVLPQLLYKALSERAPVFDVWENEESIVEDVPIKRDSTFKAWITIMYGCNNFCSYCIVPYVRGRERSRRSIDIINEAKQLAADGCKEITLLGQNVNSYGKDCDEISFAQLLRELNKIEGIKRITFMTSHPKDCSDELIYAMRDCENVAKQIHLPVQAGSNRILKKMNRRYTREDYLNLIKKIRENIPEIDITTDVIVGFPGETEEDFNETLDLIKQVGFANAFMFIYSKRTGTPAAKEVDQVPEDVKKDRLSRLIKLQAECTEAVNKKYLGKTVSVLVESVSKRSKKMVTGRTDTGRAVTFAGSSDLIGQFANVKITQVKANTLFGEYGG